MLNDLFYMDWMKDSLFEFIQMVDGRCERDSNLRTFACKSSDVPQSNLQIRYTPSCLHIKIVMYNMTTHVSFHNPTCTCDHPTYP